MLLSTSKRENTHHIGSPIMICTIIYLFIGRCKSALHHFLETLIEQMPEGTPRGSERTIMLPHCTWDKFGEILATNGARLYGLFDEMISFFSTMNMCPSSRSSVQDNRERPRTGKQVRILIFSVIALPNPHRSTTNHKKTLTTIPLSI